MDIVRIANSNAVPRALRGIASVALLGAGAVHLEQYTVAHFSAIPTIGSLFLVNFIAATVIGLVLLVPIPSTRALGRLWLEGATAVAGMGVAFGALAGLLVSEHTPLFGFREHGYRLEIVLALVSEAVAVLALALYSACLYRDIRRLAGPGRKPGQGMRCGPTVAGRSGASTR
jgi:hypothetical protein